MTTDFKPQLTQALINKDNNRRDLSYFISNTDFDMFIPGASSKVVKYGELDDKYVTFEQLMPLKKDYCIILIESEKNRGHWTCLLRNDNEFEYFDPYGITYTKALKWTSDSMNKFLDNTESDLGTLISNMNTRQLLKINNTKYQNIKFNDVATCGRWCILRIQSFMLGTNYLGDFKIFIQNQCEQYNTPSDLLVVELAPLN